MFYYEICFAGLRYASGPIGTYIFFFIENSSTSKLIVQYVPYGQQLFVLNPLQQSSLSYLFGQVFHVKCRNAKVQVCEYFGLSNKLGHGLNIRSTTFTLCLWGL